jgi:aspartyl-tRNA(Asn)/glutamyl-tRNA(Gln) amidotransferase subunit A
MDITHSTISQTREKLDKKEITAEALVNEFIKRIEQHNGDLNAFLGTYDDALEKAKTYDKGKSKGPLAGIPIAIKDNLLVKGKKVTAASKILGDYTAVYTATAMQKLEDAGAILIGRTNCDEFAMGTSTENSAFGATKNPWDTTRVSGGSSGGSAAAVVADMCAAAIGTDTGGSVRQPSSFSGCVGYKPTYGTISRHGAIAMGSTLDQIGPLTKSVGDAALLADVMSGTDPYDATTSDKQPESILKAFNDFDIKGKKIGLPKEYFSEALNPEIATRIKEVVDTLKNKGVTIKEVSLPLTEYCLAVYYIIMPAEASSNLGRYDGIRFGMSDRKGGSLDSLYTKTRTKGFGEEVRRRLMIGTYVLSSGYYDAFYARAQKVRQMIQKEFEDVYSDVDLLITPTAPTPAFKLGENSDPVDMYLQDIFTVSANVAGLPAVSIPAGTVEGLPIGMQVLGKQFADGDVLGLAGVLEKEVVFERLAFQ